ncbi:hypothetical protein LXL04_032610 [Taraxacum kok-saghyz]
MDRFDLIQTNESELISLDRFLLFVRFSSKPIRKSKYPNHIVQSKLSNWTIRFYPNNEHPYGRQQYLEASRDGRKQKREEDEGTGREEKGNRSLIFGWFMPMCGSKYACFEKPQAHICWNVGEEIRRSRKPYLNRRDTGNEELTTHHIPAPSNFDFQLLS